jgi:hypothetical protein
VGTDEQEETQWEPIVMAKKMTKDEFLKRASELLAAKFESEAEFYLFLLDGEERLVDWRGAFASFEEMLEEAKWGNLVTKYTAFREAVKKVDRQQARTIGVDGLIEASRVHDEEKRHAVVVSLTEACQRHGSPISKSQARQHVQSIAPTPRLTRDLARVMSRDKLQQENKSLRDRVKQLEQENAKLKTENAKLRGMKKAN